MGARVIVAAAAALSMMSAGAAVAQAQSQTGAAEAQPANTAKDDDSKLICRRREDPADLGTRVRSSGKRVCMTKAEWDEERHRSQEAVRNLRTGAEATAIVGPGGSGG